MPIDRRQPTDRRPPHAPRDGHAERAARIDTLDLEKRLRRWEADQRRTRAAIEAELRREHWGLPQESRNGGPDRRS